MKAVCCALPTTILLLLQAAFFTVTFSEPVIAKNASRNFWIDYENNTFVKDGQPFRYISGSFHYFRTVEQKWDDILRKFRLCGLNAVQTYVEWASHQPTSAQNYTFDGNLNVFKFLDLAQKNNLSVILRPGPYIDAERDLGGLPPWLLWQSSRMKVRTTHPDFVYYVSNWFGVLLTKLKPYLYKNGGPIIMVQVENEYGSFGCDSDYKTFLRDLMQFHLGDDVVLFTTDNAIESRLKCGSIHGVYPTVDFGPEALDSLIDLHFATQRTTARKGPLVNSEFYIGWFDAWKSKHSGKSTEIVASSLTRILQLGANVNFYMFFGGTSFGLTSGASLLGNKFQSYVTSYDYDAPLDEAGDPTEKYFAIKSVISKFIKVPDENPGIRSKGNFGQVKLKPMGSLFNEAILQLLDSNPLVSLFPQRFESLSVGRGYVLYENDVKILTSDPVLLQTTDLKDRAYIFVEEEIQGILDRSENIHSLPIRIKPGQKLRILVENQGRLSFGSDTGERKLAVRKCILTRFRLMIPKIPQNGIGAEVRLGNYILDTWKHYKLAGLNSVSLVKLSNILNYGPIFLPSDNEIHSFEEESTDEIDFHTEAIDFIILDNESVKIRKAAMLYSGTFTLNATDRSTLPDTFLNPEGWSKGHVWVNGFHLGRYWPAVGPQNTLYVPGDLLHPYPAENIIIVLELEEAPFDCVYYSTLRLRNCTSSCHITFIDRSNLDGPTPELRV